ncbi:MAG: hypothetical protein ABIT58_10910 [Ferruginibacter sp.]
MNKKKIIWLSLAGLLSIAAIFDAIRYMKPDEQNKILVQPPGRFPVKNANEILLVYNAWGGIYPGLVDFIRKEYFPKSYPCNLCYQTFGTFGIKAEWRNYLDSLQLKKTELHKDNFYRKYEPGDMKLPVILLSNGREVQLLFSAVEINQFKSLKELITALQIKLAHVD